MRHTVPSRSVLVRVSQCTDRAVRCSLRGTGFFRANCLRCWSVLALVPDGSWACVGGHRFLELQLLGAAFLRRRQWLRAAPSRRLP